MDTKLMPINITFDDKSNYYPDYEVIYCNIEWDAHLLRFKRSASIDIKIRKVTLNMMHKSYLSGDCKIHEWVGDLSLVMHQITETKLVDEFHNITIEYDGSFNQLYNGFKPSEIFIHLYNTDDVENLRLSEITIHFGGEND